MRKLFLLLWCSALSGQVVFNNTNTIGYAATTSLSVSQSVTAGHSNLAAFACVEYAVGSSQAVTITYGGQTMTPVGTPAYNTGATLGAGIFYLANPPTGSNTLAVSVSGGVAEIHAGLVSFYGVNQSTPVRSGTYQTLGANVQNPSLVITSNTSDLTMSCIGSYDVPSTNQTQDGLNYAGDYYTGDDHATTSGATVTHTWTTSSAGAVAMAGFSIEAQLAPKKKVIVVQ